MKMESETEEMDVCFETREQQKRRHAEEGPDPRSRRTGRSESICRSLMAGSKFA
jgi:hypothetical protein